MKNKFIIRYLIPIILSLTFALTGCAEESKEDIKQDLKEDFDENLDEDLDEDSKGDSYMQISMDEAIRMMETEEDYVILDVRTEEEYKEGHIPDAICVPNETIGEDDIAELPDKAQVILVYCRSGNRSKQASAKLSAQGYTNVYEFGGIIDWQGTIVSDDE